MKNIIKKLFCLHKWMILKSYAVQSIKIICDTSYTVTHPVDILICKECGKIKKIIT